MISKETSETEEGHVTKEGCCGKRLSESQNVVSKRKKSKVERYTKVLEKELLKCQKKIQEVDAEVVDLDDEVNSAYLRRSRMVKRFVESFNVFRKSSRSVHTVDEDETSSEEEFVVDLNGVAPPEITDAVRNFLKKNVASLPPTFEEMKEVVGDAIRSRSLPLSNDELLATVRSVYSKVFNEWIQFRKQGRLDDSSCVTESDPAKKDEKLESKLLENDRLKKTEEVVENFVVRSAQDQEMYESGQEEDSDISDVDSVEEGSS